MFPLFASASVAICRDLQIRKDDCLLLVSNALFTPESDREARWHDLCQPLRGRSS